jgi:hypothetical protein
MSLTLFNQLSLLAVEEKWKKVLRNMSEGIFPPKFIYCPEKRRLSHGKDCIIIDEISLAQLYVITSFITRCTSDRNFDISFKGTKVAKSLAPYYIYSYCTSNRYNSKVAKKIIQAYACGNIKRSDMTFQNGKLISIDGIHIVDDNIVETPTRSTRLHNSYNGFESNSVSA